MITCPKRSLTLGKWCTSVSLEDAFWDGLEEIAASKTLPNGKRMSRAFLAREIDTTFRGKDEKLSNAIRVFVLLDVRERALAAERRAREVDQHAAELRSTIRALTGAGEQGGDMRDGLAPMSAVIAGRRANV